MADADVSVPYPQTLRPTADELCVSAIFGQDLAIPPLRSLAESDGRSPRAVIEQLFLAAMQRGPVYVAFSGGRDSSALLAIGVAVARGESLPDPIPLTTIFTHLPESDEEEWQRLVIDHLGVQDWQRIDGGDRLELLGPYAQEVLLEHGVILPLNAHAMKPLFEIVGSGTLVTGAGGDELLEAEVYRLTSALASRRKFSRATIRDLAMHDAPAPLRRRWFRANSELRAFPWFTPELRERLLDADVDESMLSPMRFDRLIEVAWQNRGIQSLRASPDVLSRPYGSSVLQPFLSPEFMVAYADQWRYRFPGWRTRSLTQLVGDLLPESLISRVSKADFSRAFFGEATKAWLRDWDGTGLDAGRVDADALRAEWQKDEPNGCSFGLAQQAWIAAQSKASG